MSYYGYNSVDAEMEAFEAQRERFEAEREREEARASAAQDPAERLAFLTDFAAQAEAANVSRCLYGEAVFYDADTEGRLPGHIYSSSGRDEYYISRTCEYHFDEMFKDPEENQQ